jgi:acyl transferase domain-containing protein
MLSPYGQCRTFDETAGGYVRAEGGGVLILKTLADAERDGDEIFAVIKGIGINTDGRTKGIALPSSDMQEALLRQVYKDARISPRRLAYFEAHGTGTKAGDAAEAGSVGRSLAMRRPKSMPLPIGSAKSNIGHLEPAAGMAGMIKAIGVLRRRVVPPSLHVSRLNPDIDFAQLNLSVTTQPQALPETEEPSLVGVNSFGFGGTNAHVILEEYRQAPTSGAVYRENLEDVIAILEEIGRGLSSDPSFGPALLGPLEIAGVNNLADSAVEIRVSVKTRPMKQWGVRRELLKRIKKTFDERGIEIPFPHRTLYIAADKSGNVSPSPILHQPVQS